MAILRVKNPGLQKESVAADSGVGVRWPCCGGLQWWWCGCAVVLRVGEEVTGTGTPTARESARDEEPDHQLRRAAGKD